MEMSVTIFTPEQILYSGKAQSVIVPGEQGTFEVLPFHRPIVSRLVSGDVELDSQLLPVRRGVIKAYQNSVTIIVET